MAKDPAFLFYPNDWIGGTMGMTFEEKGAYMEILMMQFNRGRMTTDMIGQTIGQTWDKIKVKFTQDENNLWYNRRLEEEQIKRMKFTQSRRNNISGNNQYQNGKEKEEEKNGHTTYRMENVNVNENKGIKKGVIGGNIKGVSIDENFEHVTFNDGSKQKLGVQQKELAQGGMLKLSSIVKNSIY